MQTGEVIVKQGDLEAEHFFIVRKGSVEVHVDATIPGTKMRNGDVYMYQHTDQPMVFGVGYPGCDRPFF